MRFTKLGRETGFSFSEVLAAIVLAVVVVMGYSLSSVGVIQRQTISDNSTMALHLAQDKLEELQARKTLTDNDVCPAGGDHGISGNAGIAGIFDRCWRITPSAFGTSLKQIDVTVSWRDFQDRDITLSTLSFIED